MIPNPWLILGAIGVWIVSLIAVGAWQRGDGADAVRADWAEEKAAAATESAAAFKAITERYRDLEQSMAEGMAKIGADYANQTQALNATRRERDDLVAREDRRRDTLFQLVGAERELLRLLRLGERAGAECAT